MTNPGYYSERKLNGGSGSAFTWRSNWLVSTQYFKNDVVTHDNKVWVHITPTSTGATPGFEIEIQNWSLMIEGEEGPAGATGATGPAGPNEISTATATAFTGLVGGAAGFAKQATKSEVQTAAGISYGTAEPIGGADGDIYFRIDS